MHFPCVKTRSAMSIIMMVCYQLQILMSLMEDSDEQIRNIFDVLAARITYSLVLVELALIKIVRLKICLKFIGYYFYIF